MHSPCKLLAYTTISISFVLLLLYGATNISTLDTAQVSSNGLTVSQDQNVRARPDFSQYVALRTLTEEEFPLRDTNRRTIILGDLHGMNKPLQKLMDRLEYHPSKDVLVHVGDILTRGSHKGSLAVLDYMTSFNVTGVRGNHDQKVVEWRGWIDWLSKQQGGLTWLTSLERRYYSAHPKRKPSEQDTEDEEEIELWLEGCNSSEDKKWLPRIPAGWVIFSDHYKLARNISVEGYNYLLGLPLRIYIPSAHTFIAHAGLLPYNPVYDMDDKDRQPLARIPSFARHPTERVSHSIDDLRRMQEMGILTEIPQNKKPWVVLNMRSIKGGKVSRRSRHGKPWSKIWNKQMESCVGYGEKVDEPFSDQVFLSNSNSLDADTYGEAAFLDEETFTKLKLPCYPSTTIYGHAASRGLDIKRWSMGLDSGCVYNERLSALVLGPKEDEEVSGDYNNRTSPDRWIPYGDGGEARIFSVKC